MAEWKAISILCQKGALKAETLATVAKACDVFPLRSTEKEKGNEKFFIFSYALPSVVSLSDAH